MEGISSYCNLNKAKFKCVSRKCHQLTLYVLIVNISFELLREWNHGTYNATEVKPHKILQKIKLKRIISVSSIWSRLPSEI